MGYLKIFRGGVLILFFIQLSGVLLAQNRLLLDRQFMYPSERLGYTYISELPEGNNLLYVAIVDLQSQELVDFGFHSLEDKIIEGGITLGKSLVPGYYALLAAKPGDKEIHYEQFWVRDPLWRQLGGQEIIVSDVGDSLKIVGRISKANTQVSIFLTTNSALNEEPTIHLNEVGAFEVFIVKDSIIDNNSPVWALVELRNENDQLALRSFPVYWPTEVAQETPATPWFSMEGNQFLVHVPEVGELRIETLHELFLVEDPVFPDDTIAFYKSELPTGRLQFNYEPIDGDKFSSQEVWNYPQIPIQENDQSIIVQSGEELILDLLELDNPWVSFANYFLSVRMDTEDRVLAQRYEGSLVMADTLDRTLDLVIMRSSDPSKPRANRAVMFTNGDYLLDFRTDENGEFSISNQEIKMFGFEEGRLRYREEERKVRLEPHYPVIDRIKTQLPFLISTMHPKIIEKDESLSNRVIEMNEPFGNDERTIDLEAVVVTGQSMQERIEEVLNDRFALDWLNEDWICQHNVLNGGGPGNCIPVAGNHPSLARRIPLHLLLDKKMISLIRTEVSRLNRNFSKILRGQTIPPITLEPEVRRILEAQFNHESQVIRSYTWDDEDYKDQIGSLKLSKQNTLLVAENELTISNGQKIWMPYSATPTIKLKAPNLPGIYLLEVRYWDLKHEISSSISYEVRVR